MSPPNPVPRQRRKQERPAQIVAAATELFAERGFGATKMADVAQRAGVSKATVFVYFPTKEDLFRAVAQALVDANFARLHAAGTAPELPLRSFVPLLLQQAAWFGEHGAGAMARLLISESRAFPDLAKVWYDEVASRMLALLTEAIAGAQARGEVRAGDARLQAFSIVGPMIAGIVFREVFRDAAVELPQLPALAEQHAQTVLDGLCLR